MLDIDVSEGWARQLAHPRDTPAQLPTLPQSSMTPRAPALKSQSLAKIEWKEQRRAHTSPPPRLSIEPDQKSIAYERDFDLDISFRLTLLRCKFKGLKTVILFSLYSICIPFGTSLFILFSMF